MGDVDKRTAIAIASEQSVDHPQSTNSRQSNLQEDTYFRVLRLLQEDPDITQRELALKSGVSVGALNYCLKALIERGLVKMHNFANSKNKFGYVYTLTPRGIAERAALTGRFLKRKTEEYDALRSEIEALKAEVQAERDADLKRNRP